MNFARHLAGLLLTALLGAILALLLAWYSPGFDSDERLLDARLDDASRAAIQAEHAANHDLRRILSRGFWMSPSLHRPVQELIAERAPVTLRLIGTGTAAAWVAALAMAIAVAPRRKKSLAHFAKAAGTCFLCLPSAVLAILVFSMGGPVALVIPLVLFPRLFETVCNLLEAAYDRPHILAARAKGVTPAGILLRHALPVCAPELLSLAGVSLIMAFGAAIPVETMCDVPGLGQLAWKAATARDLPLLLALTLMIALAAQLVNAISTFQAPRILVGQASSLPAGFPPASPFAERPA